MSLPCFIGIDIGTQGARVALMDADGNIIAQSDEVFPLSGSSREQQSPEMWWNVCQRLLKSVTSQARSHVSSGDIRAIAVTSTSGTVIPLDKNMRPLHDAIMYSDPRSAEEGRHCREVARQHSNGGYTGFNASSGLSKMIWYIRTFSARVPEIARWVHASDYIMGKLSGVWDVSDPTNVLKSGYDIRENRWPSWLFGELGISESWLPRVVPSGTPVGQLLSTVADTVGLPSQVVVVAGMTDGCASQIASGAVRLGDWNTTIGTTLVIKGVTAKEVHDPLDRLYNHRHPEGFWMPGGAGNIGADWITNEYADDLALMNEAAMRLMPTGHLAYPLRSQGERFPFIAPEARGFQPEGLSRAALFTANMEGVAYVERYGYDMIESLSGEKVKAVYTAGGGSKSEAWLKIRSNVMGLPVYKMKHVSGAVGAAILAASKTYFSSLMDAAEAMTQIEKEVLPEAELVAGYAQLYADFVSILKKKGYIQN